MLFRSLISLGVVFLAAFPADAQGYRAPYGIKPKPGFTPQALGKFEASGTIEALAPGKIQMHTDAQENWLIWLNAQTKITTTGQAKQDFLYAGLLVRFKAELEKPRTLAGAIDELTVITPSPENIPGIYPLGENQSELGAGKTPPTGPCTVIGRITSLHGNKLQVNVGHGTLLGELSENAKIRLDIADYSMARKGDKISVVGVRMRGAGQAQAAQVKIELAETLAGMTTKSLPIKAQLQRRSNSPKPVLPESLPSPPQDK